MKFDEFVKQMAAWEKLLKSDLNGDLLLEIESAGLRFIDDNFRNQSWEGQAWPASEGTILVKSGALRRDFYTERHPGQVKFINRLPYADAHNRGFEGDVTVPAHQRAVFSRKGRLTKRTGTVEVKAYKRHMRLPKRQFAPYEGHESPTLNKTVNSIIQKRILKYMKP